MWITDRAWLMAMWDVGDRVTLNATAKSTGPRQSSAHFKNERIKASTVAKVGSVPSSVSPSPVTPSPSVVIASPPPVKPTAPKEPPFPVDFSTTENSLRTYIFQANVEAAAKVLARPQVVSLAAGLTYPEELSPLVEPSGQRNEDPDVVAYKVGSAVTSQCHGTCVSHRRLRCPLSVQAKLANSPQPPFFLSHPIASVQVWIQSRNKNRHPHACCSFYIGRAR